MRGRVAVATQTGVPLSIREYDVRPPRDDEVLVRITAASICGSDLHIWRGETPPLTGVPSVPGHEMTGFVEALGRSRTHDSTGQALREGDRVTFAYFIPCGECWTCLSGTTGCPNRYRLRKGLT